LNTVVARTRLFNFGRRAVNNLHRIPTSLVEMHVEMHVEMQPK